MRHLSHSSCLAILGLLCFFVVTTSAFATKKGQIDVSVLRRVASQRFTELNEFFITEEHGTRYCGNTTIPKHAVSLPWLKDLRRPAGGLKGRSEVPSNCQSILKWDGLHFCLDRLSRKSKILDLIRRCTEF